MAKDTMTPLRNLTDTERSQLKASSDLYAKHLSKLAEEARDLGKETDAKAYEVEAEQVRSDVVPKLDEILPQLRVHEMKALERGLTYFLKNLRAAKGTMRGLGKLKLAEEFEDEAVKAEAELVPRFAEQPSLV